MIYINVNIQIHYKAESKLLQNGSFQLRGRTNEQVAYEFWKWIKKKNPYEVILEKVIINAEEDITDKVKELEKQQQLKAFYESENLPF